MKSKILIRFDDICPTMNWEQWNKAKSMLDKFGAKALLGVVPDCQDPDLMIDEPRVDFWEYIKDLQSQGFTIAMHGYQHVFSIKANGIVTRNKISEFAGLPYKEQLAKIIKGKSIFKDHGIDTDVFFAPAHSYDDNTLRALKECGFNYVSDGLSSCPYKRQGITMIPCRSGGIPNLKRISGYITAVVHAHEWVRPDRAVEWTRYQNLFLYHSSEIVTFIEYCKRPCGNTIYQRHVEILFRIIKQYVFPIIFMIKRFAIGIFK